MKNSVTKLKNLLTGEHAPEGCSSLRGMRIPSKAKFLSYYSFDGCTSLRRIEIPEGCYPGRVTFGPQVEVREYIKRKRRSDG